MQDVNRVKKIFESTGLTQTEFAHSLGISQGSLNGLLSGKSKSPSSETVSALMTKFNISANWLLTGEGEMYLPVTPLTGKSTAEKIEILEARRKARFEEEKNIPLREAVEAMKKHPEFFELVKLLQKIPRAKYQQLKTILKSFLG